MFIPQETEISSSSFFQHSLVVVRSISTYGELADDNRKRASWLTNAARGKSFFLGQYCCDYALV